MRRISLSIPKAYVHPTRCDRHIKRMSQEANQGGEANQDSLGENVGTPSDQALLGLARVLGFPANTIEELNQIGATYQQALNPAPQIKVDLPPEGESPNHEG